MSYPIKVIPHQGKQFPLQFQALLFFLESDASMSGNSLGNYLYIPYLLQEENYFLLVPDLYLSNQVLEVEQKIKKQGEGFRPR